MWGATVVVGISRGQVRAAQLRLRRSRRIHTWRCWVRSPQSRSWLGLPQDAVRCASQIASDRIKEPKPTTNAVAATEFFSWSENLQATKCSPPPHPMERLHSPPHLQQPRELREAHRKRPQGLRMRGRRRPAHRPPLLAQPATGSSPRAAQTAVQASSRRLKAAPRGSPRVVGVTSRDVRT